MIFGVASGELVARVPIMGHVNGLSWHPRKNLLAFATNAKNRGVGWWYLTVE
jgi:hypothetical protein